MARRVKRNRCTGSVRGGFSTNNKTDKSSQNQSVEESSSYSDNSSSPSSELSSRYADQVIKVMEAQEEFNKAINLAERTIGLDANFYYQKALSAASEYYRAVLKMAQMERQMGKNETAEESEEKAKQFRKKFSNYAKSKGMPSPWVD